MSQIYYLSCDEIIDDFERFLQSQQGEVTAHEITKAWNKLAKKYKWDDRLIGIDKQYYQEKRDKMIEYINKRIKYCSNSAKEFKDCKDDIAMNQMYARINELKGLKQALNDELKGWNK